MIIASLNGNMVTAIFDIQDLAVLNRALQSVDPEEFALDVSDLVKRGILSDKLSYEGVVAQAVITITHLEEQLDLFKKAETALFLMKKPDTNTKPLLN